MVYDYTNRFGEFQIYEHDRDYHHRKAIAESEADAREIVNALRLVSAANKDALSQLNSISDAYQEALETAVISEKLKTVKPTARKPGRPRKAEVLR